MKGRDFMSDILLLVILAFAVILIFDISEARQPIRINKKIEIFLNSLPAKCNVAITSGYRSVEHNRKVGGTKNSYHLSNKAADLVTDCRKYIIDNAGKLGLSVIIYNKHLHLDTRSKVQCLVKLNRGYTFCHLYSGSLY